MRLNEKIKLLSIFWDRNARELKLSISQLQKQLDKLLMDRDDFKLDVSFFKDIRVNRYLFDHVSQKLGKPIKIELLFFLILGVK